MFALVRNTKYTNEYFFHHWTNSQVDTNTDIQTKNKAEQNKCTVVIHNQEESNKLPTLIFCVYTQWKREYH